MAYTVTERGRESNFITHHAAEAAARQLGAEPLGGSAAGHCLWRPSTAKSLADSLEHARPGDVIVVAAADRLGRDVPEMSNTIRELREKAITVRALREVLDSSTPVGEAMLNLLIAVGGIELAYGKERRAASRAARKARGQSIGRPKALSESKAAQLVRLVRAGEPVAMAAEAFGISRASAYRIVKDAALDGPETEEKVA
ncbi:MAG: recombinase family protein [Mycolicibacterium mageritense]|nr:MAG: recombinase family protein [Mycolicibacterium mageritense]